MYKRQTQSRCSTGRTHSLSSPRPASRKASEPDVCVSLSRKKSGPLRRAAHAKSRSSKTRMLIRRDNLPDTKALGCVGVFQSRFSPKQYYYIPGTEDGGYGNISSKSSPRRRVAGRLHTLHSARVVESTSLELRRRGCVGMRGIR